MNLRTIIQDTIFDGVKPHHINKRVSEVFSTGIGKLYIEVEMRVEERHDRKGELLGYYIELYEVRLVDACESLSSPVIMDMCEVGEYSFYRAV